MPKHQQWLKQEVAHWQAEGLVDSALAQRILARYPDAAERGWGRIIFSAIGAVLVGLGVILFFAYNWQDIPKAAKLVLVFGALAAAHGAAMTLARGAEANRALVEGLHALGTMLFGAGIWLVAQIYHIDEHYPNAFLVWSLGALALAWAIPSLVQALLFCAVAVLFVVAALVVGGIDFDPVVALLFIMGATAIVAGAAARRSAFPAAEGPLDLSESRWHVLKDSKPVEIGALPRLAQFRIEYRAPEPAELPTGRQTRQGCLGVSVHGGSCTPLRRQLPAHASAPDAAA